MVNLKFILREGVLVLRISEGKDRYYKSVKHVLKGSPNVKKHWIPAKEKFSAYAINSEYNNKALDEFRNMFKIL